MQIGGAVQRNGQTGVTIILTFLLASAPLNAQRSLNDLSGPWQLFVDDSVLVEKSNLTRTYHQFQKDPRNPVLVADQPWECGNNYPSSGIVYLYGTVLPNESGPGYRMWYATLPWWDAGAPANSSNTLYATSLDGITWTKPNLGIRTWNGSPQNNMFYSRTTRSGITSVIHTPWDPDPARKYRFMNYEAGGYWASWAPDGIHTVDAPGNPVFTGGSDVGQFMWDPFEQVYRGYVKNSWTDWNGRNRRAVALTQTTDITQWPAEQLILTPDPYDDRWAVNQVHRTHFYGLSAFAYESMYLGFLWILRAQEAEGYNYGPVYPEIVSSRDGIHWTREEGDRPAILPLGSPGQWDDGQLYTATQPLVEGDTLKLYYGACDQPHGVGLRITSCAIGLATLRKDGFASLDAGATPGSVTTRTLLGASGRLRVNCTAGGGSVRVEVLDAQHNVLPGYSAADCVPLTGTGVDQPVTWASHDQLPTTPGAIRLRFLVQNASLYSFRAADPVQLAPLPVISEQPQSLTATPGQSVAFRVQASGTGTLRYQWQKDGIPLTNGGAISGATSSELRITALDATALGAYRCIVTDTYESVASDSARLTVLLSAPGCVQNASFEAGFTAGVAQGWTPFNLVGNVQYKAENTAQHVRQGGFSQRIYSSSILNTGGIYQQVHVTPGQEYTFSVWVKTSDSNLMEGYLGIDPNGGTDYSIVQEVDFTSYQTWSKQTVSVVPPGNTVTVFLYARSTKPTKAGYVYFDDASPDCATIPPVITAHPVNQTTCTGGTVTFSVAALGGQPLSYRWQKDGLDLNDGGHYAGATTATLTVSNTNATDTAAYRCVVSNANGTATSETAALAVQDRVAPDLNGDCSVDTQDLTLFESCLLGPGVPFPPGCASRDFDGDQDVDQSDFGIFQRCYSGPGIMARPGCGD